MERKRTKRIEVVVKQADSEHVCELLNLLMEHFGYVYIALFDASPELTRKIMKQVLSLNKGYHAYGYKSFHLAFDRETGECVGFIMINSSETYSTINNLMAFINLIHIVVCYLGLFGLTRTLINYRKVATAEPRISSDEITITYIAVASRYQHRWIGTQLLEFVCTVAKSNRKKFIGLEIREANRDAYGFFKKQGFVDDSLIRSDSDELFGRGPRMHMRLDMETAKGKCRA